MMHNGAHHTRFRATRCGSFAHDLLLDGRRGRIIALFKSSFYLEAGGAIACVGNGSLHACSLNVNTTAPASLDWSAGGLKTGARWRMLGRTLHVGGRYGIAMQETETWFTTATPRHWNAMDLRRSVAELRRLCALRAPRDGLGRAVLHGEDALTRTCLGRFAMAPINGLRTWLTNAMCGVPVPGSDHPRALQQLVGLGPGLTPSGDDFLCGVLFTLHSLGHPGVAERLWDRVRPLSKDAGNAISFGHLAVAAAGGGSAPMDDLLRALLVGESGALCRLLDVAGTVGHTSGWDCVAGVLTASECWLAAHHSANHSKEAPRHDA
jgi:hypothetical protein